MFGRALVAQVTTGKHDQRAPSQTLFEPSVSPTTHPPHTTSHVFPSANPNLSLFSTIDLPGTRSPSCRSMHETFHQPHTRSSLLSASPADIATPDVIMAQIIDPEFPCSLYGWVILQLLASMVPKQISN